MPAQPQNMEILRARSKQDPRLKVLDNGINRGTGYSYSFLLSKAKGKYIASIGQDDRWEPDFLAASVDALEIHTDVAVTFSQVNIIGSNGEDKRLDESPFLNSLIAKHSQEELMVFLLKFNFVCSGSAVFRRDDIRDWHTMGDNDQLQDWNTWQYLILKGRFLFIDRVLVNYRIHGNNLSLGGVSPTQVQVELIQTRLEMIGSDAFGRFIVNSSNPNALFLTAMTAYSEVFDPTNVIHYFGLLQALRRMNIISRIMTIRDYAIISATDRYRSPVELDLAHTNAMSLSLF